MSQIEQLKAAAREKCNVQLYRGVEEYFISQKGLDEIITSTYLQAVEDLTN